MSYGKRRPGGGKPVGLNLRHLRLHLESALLREVADTAPSLLGHWLASGAAGRCSRGLSIGLRCLAHLVVRYQYRRSMFSIVISTLEKINPL